jgi:ribose-phosphate pyrophosphokinase
VIPHYAYARSDKKDAPRISIAARLVADLLLDRGRGRVLTMTLHSAQVHGFFSVPVDHMNALKVLAKHFRRKNLRDTVVVSPDLGNAKQSSHFARMLGLPVAAGSKRRLSDDRVVLDAIVGDVDGKNVIVLDDEIANGGTIVEVLHRLPRAAGQTDRGCVHPWAVHGPAIERLRAQGGYRRDRHDRHGAAPRRQTLTQHDRAVDCPASGRRHPAHPPRQVGQPPV